MTKFQNTFRIESARLKDWDYSIPWWYYVTINTKDHIEYFGVVVGERMILDDLGNVVEKYRKEIPTLFENIEIRLLCYNAAPFTWNNYNKSGSRDGIYPVSRREAS